MPEKREFYEVYSYGDDLRPGKEICIKHSISNRDDGTRLSRLTNMNADELNALRDGSVMQENKIYEKLRDDVKEWEAQASNTMLLDAAIEYVKTPPVKHTSNEWVVDNYGFECSNMVYKMTYQIREDKQYNAKTRKYDIPSWLVSWSLYYNFPQHTRGGGDIAGQDRKRFADKTKMDNYIIGRIAAFSDYFTEISPPVPKELAWKFSRNSQLLPGYTVEGQEPRVRDNGPQAKESADSGTDYSKFIRKKPQKAGLTSKSGLGR